MTTTLRAAADLAHGALLRGRALERHRLRKLRAIVRHAVRAVPHYRETYGDAGVRPEDLRTPADLARLPVLRRESVDASRLAADGLEPRACVTRRTGGSTGRALAIVTRRAELEAEALGWIRTWRRLGLRWTDRQAALKEPDDTFHEGRRRWFQRLGFLRVHHLDLYRDAAALAAELAALRPDVLRGPPSSLEAVASVAAEGAIRPRLVFTTGERLGPRARDRLRDFFAAPVHDCYGATESGCIAWRCPRCGLFHVNADRVIVEVLDGDRPVRPGEAGDVVVTNLSARAMPFVRYALGDRARLATSACPHARGAESIGALEGRTVDQIVLRGGRIVSPYRFMPDDVPGVRASTAVQVGPDEVRVLVVPEEGFRRELLAAAVRAYERGLEGACRVAWEVVEELPGGEAARLRRAGAPAAPPPDAATTPADPA